MSVKAHVLTLLSQYPTTALSGQKMADQLDVSRNAVWKAVEELRTSGYHIVSIPRLGYQLVEKSRTIDALQIRQNLNKQWQHLEIITEEKVTSTNDLAKTKLIENPQQPVLIVATEQTEGRGRRGRSFHSELDHGLYFSLGFKPDTIDFQEVSIYSLLSVTAIALALETYLEDHIAIKWVNDLFYHGKKVAGILSEVVTDLESGGISNIVIGIGLNLAGDFSKAPSDVQKVAGTLFGDDVPEAFNSNELLTSFLNYFTEFQAELPQKNFLEAYNKRLLGMDKKISYSEHNHTYTGIIRGLNGSGNLVIETPEGTLKALVGQEVHFSSKQFLNKKD